MPKDVRSNVARVAPPPGESMGPDPSGLSKGLDDVTDGLGGDTLRLSAGENRR